MEILAFFLISIFSRSISSFFKFGCGHFLLKFYRGNSSKLHAIRSLCSQICVSQYMVFWSDIEIIFALFTSGIGGVFFGFSASVPCIFQREIVLWTLPRRKNVIFFNSIGDPFSQIPIKTNALKAIISGQISRFSQKKRNFGHFIHFFDISNL